MWIVVCERGINMWRSVMLNFKLTPIYSIPADNKTTDTMINSVIDVTAKQSHVIENLTVNFASYTWL